MALVNLNFLIGGPAIGTVTCAPLVRLNKRGAREVTAACQDRVEYLVEKWC